jgi:hypothetical protein
MPVNCKSVNNNLVPLSKSDNFLYSNNGSLVCAINDADFMNHSNKQQQTHYDLNKSKLLIEANQLQQQQQQQQQFEMQSCNLTLAQDSRGRNTKPRKGKQTGTIISKEAETAKRPRKRKTQTECTNQNSDEKKDKNCNANVSLNLNDNDNALNYCIDNLIKENNQTANNNSSTIINSTNNNNQQVETSENDKQLITAELKEEPISPSRLNTVNKVDQPQPESTILEQKLTNPQTIELMRENVQEKEKPTSAASLLTGNIATVVVELSTSDNKFGNQSNDSTDLLASADQPSSNSVLPKDSLASLESNLTSTPASNEDNQQSLITTSKESVQPAEASATTATTTTTTSIPAVISMNTIRSASSPSSSNILARQTLVNKTTKINSLQANNQKYIITKVTTNRISSPLLNTVQLKSNEFLSSEHIQTTFPINSSSSQPIVKLMSSHSKDPLLTSSSVSSPLPLPSLSLNPSSNTNIPIPHSSDSVATSDTTDSTESSTVDSSQQPSLAAVVTTGSSSFKDLSQPAGSPPPSLGCLGGTSGLHQTFEEQINDISS